VAFQAGLLKTARRLPGHLWQKRFITCQRHARCWIG
jgi:hypothetical protein